ncbi:hypothetical protein P154DRAFT_115218 [Amniculicola lignicola CBS 123094]|uniref:Uncharacterized protein n=1 Tax=Amniculicola lignicola CBS 123094 TaxID=1392246 RepID=A0A6A5X144_9PLEO|nr:hypothetical protein P154DRAFT_115218 [Amniculicola lignicola CBS 123094]
MGGWERGVRRKERARTRVKKQTFRRAKAWFEKTTGQQPSAYGRRRACASQIGAGSELLSKARPGMWSQWPAGCTTPLQVPFGAARPGTGGSYRTRRPYSCLSCPRRSTGECWASQRGSCDGGARAARRRTLTNILHALPSP